MIYAGTLVSAEMTTDLIRQCVAVPEPTVLDIGCNDGTHTLQFLNAFENPRIHSFEPDPRAAARFRGRVGPCTNVSLYELALCDYHGEVTFYQSGGQPVDPRMGCQPEGWDCSGSIRKPKDHLAVYPWVTFDSTISIKTTTLDRWCAAQQIDGIDFIWMDVQGAEMDVFRGGAKALSRTRFIYTEYSNRELYEGQCTLSELLKHLKGFEPVLRLPNDVLLVNTHISQDSPATLRRLIRRRILEKHCAAALVRLRSSGRLLERNVRHFVRGLLGTAQRGH